MATRKIKDAKDLSTNELIYFKGHAKATYMSDGRTVEDAINTNGGTVTDVNVGSKSVVTNGVATIPIATNEEYGVVTIDNEGVSISPNSVPSSQVFMTEINSLNTELATKVTKVKINGVEKSPTKGVADIGSLVSSVKLNGITYNPTNGLVNLGTISSGGGGISSLGFPINVYEITMGSITQTVRPYVHYQFLYEVFFGNASATINFDSSDNTGVYALEYVLDFQKFNGNVNIDVTSYPIQWYNNEPPVFDGRGTLIYIYNNIGFWLNYELS